MLVVVNGREERLPEDLSLMDFIQSKGLAPESFVFMLNDRVLKWDELNGIILQENDRLEILRFVGGG